MADQANDNHGYGPPPTDDWRYVSVVDEQEASENKFLQKAKDNPFVPIGIFGGISALLYQAYKFRQRGDTKLSLYLIHTRVAVQGTVVGALTLGVIYSMVNEYILKPKADLKK